MNKFINQSSSKAHHKDDADIFREQSLRAIRRRKLCSKYLPVLGIDHISRCSGIICYLSLCIWCLTPNIYIKR